jgi:DNA-binding NtrC family response regulator
MPPVDPKLRILLVDDEVDYLHVLHKRMASRGLEVAVAGSGREAIQTLRNQDFDAAVLDLKMEDMDGIEVLKVFKVMEPNMAVIMLTGHGSEQAAREGIALGASDYLIKPTDLETLLQRIQKAVDDMRVKTE